MLEIEFSLGCNCLQDYPYWYDITGICKSQTLGGVNAPHPTQTQDRRYDRRGDTLQPDILFNRLHQFKQSGLFDQINVIIVGFAKEVEDYPIEDIFLEYHCPNTVLPVGEKAALDPVASTLELLEPCVK